VQAETSTRYFKSNDDIGTDTSIKSNDGTDNGMFKESNDDNDTRYLARYYSNEKNFSINFSTNQGYFNIRYIQKLHLILKPARGLVAGVELSMGNR